MTQTRADRSADLTSGPMLQKIILFSIPLAASSILQLLFNAADVIVVGKFAGSTSLAAVGATVRRQVAFPRALRERFPVCMGGPRL